jgi:hypothetical protein
MLIFPEWLILVLRFAGYTLLALAGASLVGIVFGDGYGFATLCVMIAAATAVAWKEQEDANSNSRTH